MYVPVGGRSPLFYYATTANCHFVPSEINIFPRPVALVVTPIEPAGAVVVVELLGAAAVGVGAEVSSCYVQINI